MVGPIFKLVVLLDQGWKGDKKDRRGKNIQGKGKDRHANEKKGTGKNQTERNGKVAIGKGKEYQ